MDLRKRGRESLEEKKERRKERKKERRRNKSGVLYFKGEKE